MSKFKRNIILIFGFILIVNLLFFPCNKIDYGFSYEFGINRSPLLLHGKRLEEEDKKKKLFIRRIGCFSWGKFVMQPRD